MLIAGVAFWLFPRYSPEQPHRSENLGWACFFLLNLGLILRVFSEPLNDLMPVTGSVWAILRLVAAVLQWLGGLAFVVNSWARVKER